MALCVYKIADIRTAFTNSIKECYSSGTGTLAQQFFDGIGDCSGNIVREKLC